jgi:hypothetical protein
MIFFKFTRLLKIFPNKGISGRIYWPREFRKPRDLKVK